MTKADGLRIGLALNHIAMSVDNDTFHRIKGWLKEIETIAKEEVEKEVKDDRT